MPHQSNTDSLALISPSPPPPQVQELIESGLLTEVHKFSKFIHGTATLFPEMVQASKAA